MLLVVQLFYTFESPDDIFDNHVHGAKTMMHLMNVIGRMFLGFGSAVSARTLPVGVPLSKIVRSALRLSAVLSIAVFANNAHSESPTEFYTGKQIRFVIRSEPGGGYDIVSRLIGTYLVRHIPGKPTFVPENMPGGGGIIAANFMSNVATQDGTFLTVIGDSLPMDQSLGRTPSLKSELRSLGWIGSPGSSNLLTFTSVGSSTKTIADARARETLIGGTGAGSPTSWIPLAYNKLLGTKFKLIEGYRSSNDVLLAMSRGEVEGYSGHPWASLVTAAPDLVRNKRLNYLTQMGETRESELPEVPLVTELATNPNSLDVLVFITKAFAAGRPLATTPGVPPERLAVLRKAFDDTMVDPDFIAAAQKIGLNGKPVTGATVESLVAAVIGAPPSVKLNVTAVLPLKTD